MTDEILGKLEHAFCMGCRDQEACLYAGIDPSTLYQYQHKNSEFSKRKSMLKLNPVLKAKTTLMKHLGDPKIAMWLLERQDLEGYNMKFVRIKSEEEENGEFWNEEERETIVRILSKINSSEFVLPPEDDCKADMTAKNDNIPS